MKVDGTGQRFQLEYSPKRKQVGACYANEHVGQIVFFSGYLMFELSTQG